jgi:Trp operon repressor
MKQVESSNYYVTKDGNVINSKTQRILKPITISSYYYVSILGKKKSIHSLVANAYLVKPNNNFEINHKDGNKLNNHYLNLEYVSHLDNMRHAYKTGLISIETRKKNADNARKVYKLKTNRHTSAKLTKEQVIEIKELLKQEMKQEDIAKKYGVSRTPISHINTGKSWKDI